MHYTVVANMEFHLFNYFVLAILLTWARAQDYDYLFESKDNITKDHVELVWRLLPSVHKIYDGLYEVDDDIEQIDAKMDSLHGKAENIKANVEEMVQVNRAALENLSSTVEALALKVEALSWTNQMTRAKDEQMMQEIDRKTRNTAMEVRSLRVDFQQGARDVMAYLDDISDSCSSSNGQDSGAPQFKANQGRRMTRRRQERQGSKERRERGERQDAQERQDRERNKTKKNRRRKKELKGKQGGEE